MMNSTNEADPFLQVQQDVLAQLTTTRQLFTSYLRIRSLNPSTTSPELQSAKADLLSALDTLAEDLTDLSGAVKAVEHNPAAFGLDGAEVTRRRRLVQQAEGEVEDMREELAKGPATIASGIPSTGLSRTGGGKRSSEVLPDPSSFALDSPRRGPRGDAANPYAMDDGDEEDRYAEFEHRQQMHMMREQDQHLDGVFQTVGNLRRQADDMGRELEEQAGMLEVVDDLADRVGGRLQTGMKKMQEVIRANEDRLSSYCIGLLIMVLIILLVLLLIL